MKRSASAEENERLRAEADAARVTAEALAVAAREDAAVDPPRTFARYCELRAMAFDALTIAEEANPHLTDEERARAVAHNRDFAAQYRRMPGEIEAERGTPGAAKEVLF